MRGKSPLLRINTQFFKKWTAEMAYVLGYIAADGCLMKRKDRKNSWVLNIAPKDRNHLENIRKVLNSEHAISLKYNGQGDMAYQIQICHFEICRDLFMLGIHPQKTFTLEFINVPREFFSDFLTHFQSNH